MCGKIIAFFIILPFGQLVPFLAWIESFGFKWFTKFLNFFDLETKDWAYEKDAMLAFEEAGGDILYEYIQQKLYSHAGFIM
jgi:hypothetical protein